LTVRKTHILIALAASLLLGAVVVPRSSADTSDQLKATKARLAELSDELNELAAQYSAAQTRLAQTQERIAGVTRQIAEVKEGMRDVRRQLSARAREAYESGGAGTVELLLSSSTFSEFSDRVVYLGQVAQQDTDLITKARVSGEKLRRLEEDLDALKLKQQQAVQALQNQKAAIGARLQTVQSEVASLQRKLDAERRAAAAAAAIGVRIVSGGALQACPVGQPRAYSNDFGAPRSGGRSHQGNDIMAPYGTPVYAAQSGRLQQSYNSLGGVSALVYASNGDYTYYAHLASYAGVGNGGSVSAGTMIGHVGTSGNASGGAPHLHFEYHPGGGGAVNPYPYLKAVCG
jgi:murein DD-endopeptidase MepM/ murein hydrolase activator NlpD